MYTNSRAQGIESGRVRNLRYTNLSIALAVLTNLSSPKCHRTQILIYLQYLRLHTPFVYLGGRLGISLSNISSCTHTCLGSGRARPQSVVCHVAIHVRAPLPIIPSFIYNSISYNSFYIGRYLYKYKHFMNDTETV